MRGIFCEGIWLFCQTLSLFSGSVLEIRFFEFKFANPCFQNLHDLSAFSCPSRECRYRCILYSPKVLSHLVRCTDLVSMKAFSCLAGVNSSADSFQKHPTLEDEWARVAFSPAIRNFHALVAGVWRCVLCSKMIPSPLWKAIIRGLYRVFRGCDCGSYVSGRVCVWGLYVSWLVYDWGLWMSWRMCDLHKWSLMRMNVWSAQRKFHEDADEPSAKGLYCGVIWSVYRSFAESEAIKDAHLSAAVVYRSGSEAYAAKVCGSHWLKTRTYQSFWVIGPCGDCYVWDIENDVAEVLQRFVRGQMCGDCCVWDVENDDSGELLNSHGDEIRIYRCVWAFAHWFTRAPKSKLSTQASLRLWYTRRLRACPHQRRSAMDPHKRWESFPNFQAEAHLFVLKHLIIEIDVFLLPQAGLKDVAVISNRTGSYQLSFALPEKQMPSGEYKVSARAWITTWYLLRLAACV